jgi:hypothetical protein
MVRFLPLSLVLLLAACSEAEPPAAPAERDPAVAAALAQPLFSDRDLVASSLAGTTLTGGGPADGGIPLIRPRDDEAERARELARGLVGGALSPAPPATSGPDQSPLARALTAEAIAAAIPFARPCAPALDYSFAWAARLPAALPVYPRAATQEAGGSDKPGCKLRVVNFRSAASPADLVDFYFASAARAGLAPRHTKAGSDAVVSGNKGTLAFAVHIRTMADGTTEADLITRE